MDIDTFETKEIEIKWKGISETVKMRELSAGELRKIRKKYTTQKVVGNQLQEIVDGEGANFEVLQMSILNAPFETTSLDEIEKLPLSVVVPLLRTVEALSEVGIEKKENGVELSEEVA
jgi:hypothetical protein